MQSTTARKLIRSSVAAKLGTVRKVDADIWQLTLVDVKADAGFASLLFEQLSTGKLHGKCLVVTLKGVPYRLSPKAVEWLTQHFA